MTVELPEDARAFVQQLKSGAYANESELLADAVAMMRQYKERVADIEAAVQRGRDDMAAGRFTKVSRDDTFDSVKAKLLERGEKRSVQRNKSPTH